MFGDLLDFLEVLEEFLFCGEEVVEGEFLFGEADFCPSVVLFFPKIYREIKRIKAMVIGGFGCPVKIMSTLRWGREQLE